MDKLMGKPKGQKVAATREDIGKEISTLENSGEENETQKIASTSARTLAQLLEQQKALADQIMAWRTQDF